MAGLILISKLNPELPGAHTYLWEKNFTTRHEKRHVPPHITLPSLAQWRPQPPSTPHGPSSGGAVWLPGCGWK